MPTKAINNTEKSPEATLGFCMYGKKIVIFEIFGVDCSTEMSYNSEFPLQIRL